MVGSNKTYTSMATEVHAPRLSVAPTARRPSPSMNIMDTNVKELLYIPWGSQGFKFYLMSLVICLRLTRAQTKQACTTKFLLCSATLILEVVV